MVLGNPKGLRGLGGDRARRSARGSWASTVPSGRWFRAEPGSERPWGPSSSLPLSRDGGLKPRLQSLPALKGLLKALGGSPRCQGIFEGLKSLPRFRVVFVEVVAVPLAGGVR